MANSNNRVSLLSVDMSEYLADELKKKRTTLDGEGTELDRFICTVSHDLRSPLIAVRGFIGLLRKDMEEGNRERMKRHMERIEAAVARMEDLLNDLIELTRIGLTENPYEEVSLGEVASETVELFSWRIKEGGITVEISPDLPSVFADRQRIREVYQNLIENAVKFLGDQPEPRIEIGMKEENGEKVYYVRDNGIGIDPRYREKIFGLFERLETEHEGAGIGLAIVKRIIELYGGAVWVESEGEGKGKGSTFYFTLPKRGEAERSDDLC